jgi:DNA recombination protein RmuC
LVFVIGNLISKNKSNGGADSALLADYKSQLEAERGKTENSIKLTAELSAMKETVQKLSQQSNEANRIRTEAEAKLETTINEMRRASESIFDETKKIAGALSSSQTRGKFGEAQLRAYYCKAPGFAMATSTPDKNQPPMQTHPAFQISR